MIAVIFEVVPAPDKRDAYLNLAANLKPLLEQIDGFIAGPHPKVCKEMTKLHVTH